MTKQGWILVSFSMLTGWLPMLANASKVQPAFTDQPRVMNVSKSSSASFKQAIGGSAMKMRSVAQ